MGPMENLPSNAEQSDPQAVRQALNDVTEGLQDLQADLIVQLKQLQADKSQLLREIKSLRTEQQRLQSQRLDTLSKHQVVQQQQWAKQLAQAVANYLQEVLVQHLNQLAAKPRQSLAEENPNSGLLSPASDEQYAGNAYRLLASLDTTMSTTFKSLQSDLNSYQSALNQQLSNMHTMEQQGAAILEALVARLNEQLAAQTQVAPTNRVRPQESWEQENPFSRTPLPDSLSGDSASYQPTQRQPAVANEAASRSSASSHVGNGMQDRVSARGGSGVASTTNIARPATPAPTTPEKPKPKSLTAVRAGLILVLLSSLSLSIYNVILKVILKKQTVFGLFEVGGLISPNVGNSLLILWLRMLLVVPLMAGLASMLYPNLWQDVRQFLTLRDRALVRSALGSGLFLFLSQVLIYIALGQISVGIAITIFFIYPIVTQLLAWQKFGDRPTLFRVAVMVAIVLGGILALPSGGAGPSGNLLLGCLTAAGSGITFAFYVIQMQASAQRMNPVPVSLIQFSIIFILSSVSLLVPLPAGQMANVAPGVWPSLIIGGGVLALVTLLGYLFNNIGIRMVGAARASIVGATGPAISAILAWVAINEALQGRQWFGVLLVTVGVVGLSLEKMLFGKKAATR